MKKIGIIGVAMMLMCMSFAMADPTIVDLSWNGAGGIYVDIEAGDDATADFSTGGDLISGQWHAIDKNDNPI